MADINTTTLQTGASLLDFYNQAAGLTGQTAQANEAMGAAAALELRTKGLAELKTQEQKLSAATALGTNPDDAAYMLGELAQTVRQTYAQRDAAILATQKASGTNLFTDGPMAWLEAQIDLPQLQQQQETSEARYTNAKDAFSTLNNLTQTAAQTFNAIEQTKTVSSVEAEAERAVLEGQILSNAAKIDGLKLNAAGVKEAQNMRQQVFDNNYRLRAEARENERLAMARQAAAEAKERATKDKKNIASYVEMVNVARSAVGLPTYDEAQITMRSNTQAGKLELDDYFERGMVMAQTGKQFIGTSPSQTMAFVSQNPAAKLSPGAQELTRDLMDFAGGALNRAAATSGKAIPAKDRTAVVDAAIAEEAKRMQTNVLTKGNWYSPMPMNVIVDNEVKDLALVRKLVDPLMQGGQTDFRPDQLLPQALELVKKGELNVNDAISGITALSRKSVAYNNAYRNYAGIGMPPQQAFNARIEATGSVRSVGNDIIDNARAGGNPVGAALFGMVPFLSGTSTRPIDLTDSTQVGKYANEYLAQDIYVRLQNRQLPSKTNR